MFPLRLISILALSALASSTSDPVDCDVETNFQDPSLRAAILSSVVPVNNKLPAPYRGANWGSAFGVLQITAVQYLMDPNKVVIVNSPRTELTTMAYISADNGGGFEKLRLEQYAVYCIARTANTLVVYLMDCTVDILDTTDLSEPPFESYRFSTAQRIDLPALKDDDFADVRNTTNPPLTPSITLRVTYHPESIAELLALADTTATGYGVTFDNFRYGLKRSPGSRVPCPIDLSA
ncbi:hypothetical protein PG988_000748 [Apiospora saccharicola]